MSVNEYLAGGWVTWGIVMVAFGLAGAWNATRPGQGVKDLRNVLGTVVFPYAGLLGLLMAWTQEYSVVRTLMIVPASVALVGVGVLLGRSHYADLRDRQRMKGKRDKR